jgi:hypothetical protein
MTQENTSVDVSIGLGDIQTVLNRDAKFALQVQNAALNRTVAELVAKLDTANLELASVKSELEKIQSRDNKSKKGG